jgi:hypothetical protein
MFLNYGKSGLFCIQNMLKCIHCYLYVQENDNDIEILACIVSFLEMYSLLFVCAGK